MKTAIFDSTQVPHRCAICNKVIENYESMPQIWSPEHDGYICYDCYKKTCENPDLMDYIKKTAIEPVFSLQYVISDFLQAGKEKIEGPFLDEFKKDIPGFKEELEDIASDFLNELGDLLDRFNNKYGKFLKLEADVNFSIKEFHKEAENGNSKQVFFK